MQLKTIVLSALLALAASATWADEEEEDRRSGQVTAPVATDLLQLNGTLYRLAPGVSVRIPGAGHHTAGVDVLEPGMNVDFTVSDPGNPPSVPPTIDHLWLVND